MTSGPEIQDGAGWEALQWRRDGGLDRGVVGRGYTLDLIQRQGGCAVEARKLRKTECRGFWSETPDRRLPFAGMGTHVDRDHPLHAPGVPADARPSYAGDSDVWHRADRVSADTPSFLAAPQVAPPSPNVAAACAALPGGRTPSQPGGCRLL